MYDDPTDYDEGFGPVLWDATPGVCCAVFQTGACSHTEDYDWDEDEAAEAEAEQAAIMATVIDTEEPF